MLSLATFQSKAIAILPEYYLLLAEDYDPSMIFNFHSR